MCKPYDPRELLERVKVALVELQWKFGDDPERLTLLMGYGGRNGLYLRVLQVRPQHPLIAFYTHVQCRVPEPKRAALAEYLARANYGLWLGNFEMDLRDGEIRCETSLHLADGELINAMVCHLFLKASNSRLTFENSSWNLGLASRDLAMAKPSTLPAVRSLG